MKRSEFIEQYDNLADCLSFAYNESIECITDHMYTSEAYDDYVWDEIHEWNDGWESLGDYLSNLPNGYEFYWIDDWGDVTGMDDYDWLNDVKNDILDAMDGLWDPEDEDEEEIDEAFIDDVEDDEPQEYIEAPPEEEIFGLSKFSTEICVGDTSQTQIDIKMIW